MSEPRDDLVAPPADPLGSPLARAAFEAAQEGLLLLAPDGAVIAMNAAFGRLYGLVPSDQVGRHYSAFADGLEVRRLDGAVGPESWVTPRALRGERVDPVLQTIRDGASGREFVARCGAVPLFEGGRLVAATVTVEDATEHVRAQQAVVGALSAAEAGAYRIELVERRIWGDANFARIHGLTDEEASGGPLGRVYELMHPEDEARVAREVGRATRSDGLHELEYRVLLPSGGTRWILSRGRAEIDEEGTAVRRVGSIVDVTARREAEEAARRGGDTFASLVENSPFGIYAVDADFRLALVSQGAQKVFENVRPLLGRDFGEVMRTLWPEPFASEVLALFRHTLETGERYRAPSTVEARRDVDEIEAYDWKVERMPLPDGRLGAVCSFYDLSERHRHEAEMRESEARYRQVAEGLPQLVWGSGPDGSRDYLNGRWTDYTGTRSEDGEDPWLSPIHPEERERASAAWTVSVSGGEPFEGEYRLRGVDGRYQWFLGRAIALRDEAGEVVRWFGTFTDIDAQKGALRSLESANRLGQALAADLDPARVVQALTDASTEAVGAQFGSFFYARPEEALGPDGGERFGLYALSGAPPEAFADFPPVRSTPLFTPTFRGEGVVRSDDVSADPRFSGMPAGHLPVRSYLAMTVRGRDGEVLGGLLFGHSESGRFTHEHERLVESFAAQASVAYENAVLYERLRESKEGLERRVEARTQELTRANRDLHEFSYSVAHDLRAPLRAIVSTSRILLEDAGERLQEDERAALERQATNALRLAKIVDDLLQFARLAKADLRRESIDLTRLARRVADEVLPRWEGRRVEVAEGLRAVGDPSLVEYALTNLLDNACKFSPEGGTVSVGEAEGAFFVRDQGVGFDMAHAHKLFVAFERLVDQETFQGTGVGLANVKRIVERHGGKVWAESEPGKGATFWFTLG